MAQTTAVKQSKANARAQKQLGHNTWRKAFMQHYWLYIMMLPALLYMIIFNYLPMTGLYMAFTDFSPFNGDTILECVFGSPFAGLKYFKKLFTGPDFWTLFRNTLSISLANLFFAFPAPIILALILNELRCKWFKRTAQTLVYIPHFVSIVIVAASKRSALDGAPKTTAMRESPFRVALAEMQMPAPPVVPVLRPVMPSYRRRSLLVLTSWVCPPRRVSVQMPV